MCLAGGHLCAMASLHHAHFLSGVPFTLPSHAHAISFSSQRRLRRTVSYCSAFTSSRKQALRRAARSHSLTVEVPRTHRGPTHADSASRLDRTIAASHVRARGAGQCPSFTLSPSGNAQSRLPGYFRHRDGHDSATARDPPRLHHRYGSRFTHLLGKSSLVSDGQFQPTADQRLRAREVNNVRHKLRQSHAVRALKRSIVAALRACLLILSTLSGLAAGPWPTTMTALPRRTRPRRSRISSMGTTCGPLFWTWSGTWLGGGCLMWAAGPGRCLSRCGSVGPSCCQFIQSIW